MMQYAISIKDGDLIQLHISLLSDWAEALFIYMYVEHLVVKKNISKKRIIKNYLYPFYLNTDKMLSFLFYTYILPFPQTMFVLCQESEMGSKAYCWGF